MLGLLYRSLMVEETVRRSKGGRAKFEYYFTGVKLCLPLFRRCPLCAFVMWRHTWLLLYHGSFVFVAYFCTESCTWPSVRYWVVYFTERALLSRVLHRACATAAFRACWMNNLLLPCSFVFILFVFVSFFSFSHFVVYSWRRHRFTLCIFAS